MDDIIKLLTPDSMGSKQAALVTTAFMLFRKHGLQRVTIEEICVTAKVSRVTFYKHYNGKDELFLYIIRSLIEDLRGHMTTLLEAELSIKHKFDQVSILKQHFAAQLGDELMRGMFSLPAAKAYLDDLTTESWSQFRALVLDEQQKGRINPRLNIDVILAFLNEVNKLYAAGGLSELFATPEEMISQVNELIVYGMLARKEDR